MLNNFSIWDRLSAWRGFASLAVALGHAVQVFVNFEYLYLRIYSGLLAQASVMIFFAISGYSIAAAVQRSLLQKAPWRHYFINRVARIFPALMFSLLFMYLLYSLTGVFFKSGSADFLFQEGLARSGFYVDSASVVGAFFFLNGFFTLTPSANGPLWSLSYEVWLYLIWFLVALSSFYRQLWPVYLAACVYILLVYFDDTKSSRLFLKYSIVWFSGVGVFHFRGLLESNSHSKSRIWLRKYGWGVGVALFLASLCFAWIAVRAKLRCDLSWFNLSVGLLFCVYLLLSNHAQSHKIARVFQYSSRFSYTLYLIHFPLFLFVFGCYQSYFIGHPILALLCAVAALFLAVVIARFLAIILEDKEMFVLVLNRVGKKRFRAA